MPTVRAGLMMTNVSLCRLQQQQQRRQAGRQAGAAGCAAEGEGREEGGVASQKRNCWCTFLMACMETRLEPIVCLSPLLAEAVFCHR